MDLTPRQIVAELDKYIIGQTDAKRAVAVALRNRYRRQRLAEEFRDEIVPKNILMIGPTGVGKTEIARRLAKLADAPFVKVEATKFTEVGYVGRDVDSIVRDLVESAVRMVKAEKLKAVETEASAAAEERLLGILVPEPKDETDGSPFGALFGMSQRREDAEPEDGAEREQRTARRQRYRKLLELGELDDQTVEVEIEDQNPQFLEVFSNSGMEDMGINLQDLFGGMLPKKKRHRRVTVAEARRILAQEEANKLLDMDSLASEAVQRTEQSGIVFLDELDKIAAKDSSAPDVSREGVQRDILPIVEGSTILTKHGPVRTDFVLFIAAGAFHVARPADLIPELQGRFPIRVELDSLQTEDFQRILTEPRTALTKQYKALLAADGVELVFTQDGIEEIAKTAELVNQNSENIGARRLHTVLEKLLEEVSFDADILEDAVVIDREYVVDKLGEIIASKDLTQFIL